MKNNNEASREELIRYIEVLTKKNEALEEFIDKKYTKAINYTHSCTELCDKEKQAYEKGWEDGAKVGADDVSSRM